MVLEGIESIVQFAALRFVFVFVFVVEVMTSSDINPILEAPATVQ